MILRFLNWQGIAGIAVAAVLLVMLTVQKLEAVHWKKESERFEQLHQQEQAAFSVTVANARAAADAARTADKANAHRVAAEQGVINERIMDDFETRLAHARARAANPPAGRLRLDAKGATDTGAGRSSAVPGLSPSAGGPAQASGEDRLPVGDALTATEQAIQLDELIKWVRRQHDVLYGDDPAKVVAKGSGLQQ